MFPKLLAKEPKQECYYWNSASLSSANLGRNLYDTVFFTCGLHDAKLHIAVEPHDIYLK